MFAAKPRNRLVNFRLTEEEYTRLTAICASRESRSISDFARAAILGVVEPPAVEGGLAGRVAGLEGRVRELEAALRDLRDYLSVRGRETLRSGAPAADSN
jgi:hypothetical protein